MKLPEYHPLQEAGQPGAAHKPSGLDNPGNEILIGALSIPSILNLVLICLVANPALDTVLMIMSIR